MFIVFICCVLSYVPKLVFCKPRFVLVILVMAVDLGTYDCFVSLQYFVFVLCFVFF